MGWLSDKFGRGQKRSRERKPAAAVRARRAAESGKPAAERPVDLSGEVAPAGLPPNLAAQVSKGLRELAAELTDEGARALIAELESRIEGGDLGLPPMPQAVLRAQQMLDSPDCRLEDLASEIQMDAALATKMVGVANSPFYAGMDRIQSVADAIVRVGLRETHHLLLAIVLRSRILRAPGFEVQTDNLWRHSLAASLCAQALAAELGEDPDPAYLLGLVHDVGRVILLASAAQVGRDTRGASRVSDAALGRVADELHGPLGALIAQTWNFPEQLVHAIAAHHHPEEAPPSARALASVLATTDLLARRVAEEISDGELWEQLQLPEGLEREEIEGILAEATETFQTVSKSF